MFDSVNDVGVVDAIIEAARGQNAMCARELSAVGELYARRAPADDAERFSWAVGEPFGLPERVLSIKQLPPFHLRGKRMT